MVLFVVAHFRLMVALSLYLSTWASSQLLMTAGFAVQQRVRNASRTGSAPAPLPSRAAKFRQTSALMVLPLVSQRMCPPPLLSMSQILDRALQKCD